MSAAAILVNDADPPSIDSGTTESDQHLNNSSQETASPDRGEPVVTRRELWSYYCKFPPAYFSDDLYGPDANIYALDSVLQW